MFQVMIKCKTKSKLKALLKHGIDVKGDMQCMIKKIICLELMQSYLKKIKRD